MIVRQLFENDKDLPPKGFMMQILDSASKMYVFLWERKNEENILMMTWDDIRQYYNKNTFRTNLRKLSSFGLLDYRESAEGLAIELVGWEDMMDE